MKKFLDFMVWLLWYAYELAVFFYFYSLKSILSSILSITFKILSKTWPLYFWRWRSLKYFRRANCFLIIKFGTDNFYKLNLRRIVSSCFASAPQIRKLVRIQLHSKCMRCAENAVLFRLFLRNKRFSHGYHNKFVSEYG